MTNDEVLKQLADELRSMAHRDHEYRGDTEALHVRADGILLTALEVLGAKDIAAAFREADDKVGFWYA